MNLTESHYYFFRILEMKGATSKRPISLATIRHQSVGRAHIPTLLHVDMEESVNKPQESYLINFVST